jgi:thiol:disulfide interchange protein DsbA
MKQTAKYVFAGLIVLARCAPVPAQSGQDPYTEVRPAQPTQAAAGQVEVVEVFYYGCIHCYNYEPHLAQWLRSKPANTVFRRIPAVFGRNYIPLAKAYYTAEKLGILETMHHALFEAIHKNKRNIFDEEAIKNFFIEQGVDGVAFNRVYNSMEISTKTRQAEVMVRNYRITGVPALVINGKYLTSPSQAGDYDRLHRLVNSLVARVSESQ